MVASNRTLTDLILEGMGIVADGYKDTIMAYRQEQRPPAIFTPNDGVQQP